MKKKENEIKPAQRLKEIEKLESRLKTLKKAEEKKLPIDIYEKIPKKTAAAEILKHLKISRMLGLGATVGLFLVLIAGVFNYYASYGVAFVVIIPAVFYANKAQQEIVRLQKEYNL